MLSFVESLKQIIADVQATGGAVVERSLPSPDLLQKLREYAVQQIATIERAEYHLLEWFTEGFFDEYVRVCVIHLRKLGIMDDEIVYRLITKVIDSSLSGKYPSPSKAQDFDKRLVVSLVEIWDQMGDEQTVAYTFSQERWLIAWDYQKSQWKVTGLGRLLLELSPVQAAIFLLSIDTFFSTGEHDFRHVSADVLRNILHPQPDSEEIPRLMLLHRDILTRLGILREPDDYHPDRIQFTPVGKTVLDRVLSKDNPFRDAARTLIETEELGDTFKGSSLETKDVLHIVNHSDLVDDTNRESIATSVQPIKKDTALDTVQIFLSYAREDEEKVEKLYQKLSDAGFKPWMDKKDIFPGEQWKSRIPQAIRRSDFFLACLSANSVSKRGFIQREIRDALDIWQEKLDSDIYLIPVRLEDCGVPESLRDFQWVNLFEENGWTRLVEAIQVGMERRAEVSTYEEPSSGTEMATPEGPERVQMLYTSGTGRKILMVQTWADRPRGHPGDRRTLLKMVLRVYGNRLHPVPQEEADQCIKAAIAAILSYNPDIVGLGGMGKTTRKIRSGLERAGYKGVIDYWGYDSGILASEFLRRYGVEPPY